MSVYPTVSFIIPTIGRDTLDRAVDSIEQWMGDEVLVIQHGTVHSGWGAAERNEGLAKAKCDYIAFIDDDDWYLPGHRKAMHEAAVANTRNFPILFRMRYPSGRVIWDDPKFRCGNVGSPMIFVPNMKEKFPVWENERVGDFNWLNSLGPGWEHRRFIFVDHVIAQISHEDMRWWKYQDKNHVLYPKLMELYDGKLSE